MKYELDEATKTHINETFTYHTPKEDQPQRYVEIREKAKELAFLIAGNTPKSTQQSQALTHLNLCVMSANSAIAINE